MDNHSEDSHGTSILSAFKFITYNDPSSDSIQVTQVTESL